MSNILIELIRKGYGNNDKIISYDIIKKLKSLKKEDELFQLNLE